MSDRDISPALSAYLMFGLLDAIAIRLQVFAGTIDEHRIDETTVKDCQLLEPRRLDQDS